MILSYMMRSPDIREPARGYPTQKQVANCAKNLRRQQGAKNAVWAIRELVRKHAYRPEAFEEAFIFGATEDDGGYPYVGSGTDDDHFVLAVTSRALVESSLRFARPNGFAIFHADATFKLSDLGYPCIACGFTDARRVYQLTALFIVNRRTQAEYAKCLRALVKIFHTAYPTAPFAIKAVMGDAEAAQYNAFASVPQFANATYLMCFFHFLYNTSKRIRHLSASLKQQLISDMMALHYAFDSTPPTPRRVGHTLPEPEVIDLTADDSLQAHAPAAGTSGDGLFLVSSVIDERFSAPQVLVNWELTSEPWKKEAHIQRNKHGTDDEASGRRRFHTGKANNAMLAVPTVMQLNNRRAYLVDTAPGGWDLSNFSEFNAWASSVLCRTENEFRADGDMSDACLDKMIALDAFVIEGTGRPPARRPALEAGDNLDPYFSVQSLVRMLERSPGLLFRWKVVDDFDIEADGVSKKATFIGEVTGVRLDDGIFLWSVHFLDGDIRDYAKEDLARVIHRAHALGVQVTL
ncbi:hypothetical protein ATCC90586_008186 [Pythium insidiosum]|nr:hypothetical protein ATCC90586_008186 [Pythium insidiosum]